MPEELEVKEFPFPYFVRDGLLDSQVVQDIKRNWPGPGYFFSEIPGNWCCTVEGIQKNGFWKDFCNRVFPLVTFNVLKAFAPWIEAKYPGVDDFLVSNYSLMQSEGDYGGHNVHNHHYHNPTWVATFLIYLDEPDGHQGTTVMKLKEGFDEVKSAAKTLGWQGITEEHETVDFKPNRIFAFHDNPIAYHCVKPSKGVFGRRVFRAHLAVDGPYCDKAYGVDYPTYHKRRIEPTEDPEVLRWLEKDLELLRNPVKMSEADKEAWIMRKRIQLPKEK